MAHFDILIDYATGNSFGSEEITGESLGIVTSELATAKENLKRIKEHYATDAKKPDYGKRFELELLTDEGPRTVTPFWIGYFETLRGARIAHVDDEMAFTV